MFIEKIFNILKDGKWHDLNEITDQLSVQTDRVDEFLKFLSKKGMISFRKKNRIKIKPEWQNILLEEKRTQAHNQKTSMKEVRT